MFLVRLPPRPPGTRGWDEDSKWTSRLLSHYSEPGTVFSQRSEQVLVMSHPVLKCQDFMHRVKSQTLLGPSE